MDDGDEVVILIVVCVAMGIILLASILSFLVLDFSDKFHTTIMIGELVSIGIMALGIWKIKNDLAW
jgi:hypothetical protein